MKKIVALSACVLPLSACGWWDGALAPYYASSSPYNHYGHNNYQARYSRAPYTRAPGFHDRRRAKGVVSLEGGVGLDYIAGGHLIDAGNARSDGLSINSAPNTLSMRDAFGTGTRYDMTATYPVNENRFFTGTAYRTTHNGKLVNLRSQNGAPLVGQLSDYQAHGIEFGLRQYSPTPRGIIHPFVEGRIGGAYVDDIAVSRGVERTALFESGWVPSASAMIGFEAPTSNRFTVGMETGLRYQGRLGAVSKGPSRAVIGNARSSGTLISAPVILRGRYKF